MEVIHPIKKSDLKIIPLEGKRIKEEETIAKS